MTTAQPLRPASGVPGSTATGVVATRPATSVPVPVTEWYSLASGPTSGRASQLFGTRARAGSRESPSGGGKNCCGVEAGSARAQASSERRPASMAAMTLSSIPWAKKARMVLVGRGR